MKLARWLRRTSSTSISLAASLAASLLLSLPVSLGGGAGGVVARTTSTVAAGKGVAGVGIGAAGEAVGGVIDGSFASARQWGRLGGCRSGCGQQARRGVSWWGSGRAAAPESARTGPAGQAGW